MLPRNNRLSKNKDFEAVIKQGRSFSFANIVLKVRKNDAFQTRLGVVVGLRFSKKAVLRNRIRRQIRKILHQELELLSKGVDIAVIVKKQDKEKVDMPEIADAIRGVLKKANLITSLKK